MSSLAVARCQTRHRLSRRDAFLQLVAVELRNAGSELGRARSTASAPSYSAGSSTRPISIWAAPKQVSLLKAAPTLA